MTRRTRDRNVSSNSQLRPLEAKALKSIVDTLRTRFPGSRVLDLFSGTGKFGIAAWENGADSVLFIEKHGATAQALGEKVQSSDGFEVRSSDVFSELDRLRSDFDLCFADPPYPVWDQEFANRLLRSVRRVLKPGAILLVRFPKRVVTSVPASPFRLWKNVVSGESMLWYLVFEENNAG